MNDLLFNPYPFHKKTFFPSIVNSIQFSPSSEQIYYTSGNKLVSYDIIKGTKQFRLNLNGAPIISFTTDCNKVYALDSNHLFFEYDLVSNSITSSIQLKHEYSMMHYSKGKYYLYGKDMFIAVIDLIPSDKGTLMKLIEELEIVIKDNNTTSSHKEHKDNQSKPVSPSKVFDIRNEYMIISKRNTLGIYNIISKKTKQIEFQRKITSGCFISDTQIVIGDQGGKMHFISDFNEQNYIISTKHWHAHRVSALILDSNESFLYSGGEEGVIVIWNLKNNTSTFIPRLNGFILALSVSPDSKFLSAHLNDSSIKIVSLPNMKVIQEINTITKESIIKKAHMLNEDFLVFGGVSNGLIQFYNINQGTFPFELSIMNKNFVSRTERELVNRKQLKHLHIISNKENSDNAYMITIEDIDSGESDANCKALITYVKFWRINSESIDLITLGENPHLNEEITIVEGRSHHHHPHYTFITGSKSQFKLWALQSNDTHIEKFICVFQGKYKETTLSSCLISNKDIVYSLNESYLIKWNMNITKHQNSIMDSSYISSSNGGIEAIYSFGDNISKERYTLKRINKSTICLLSSNKLKAFSTDKWEELWSEEYSDKIRLINVINDVINNEVVVFIQSQANPNTLYAFRYEDFEGKKISNKCQVLSKKGIEYVDIFKHDYLIVTNRRDIFISSVNQRIKEEEEEEKANVGETPIKERRVTKKEMDDNDIEMVIKPKKHSISNK